MDVQDKVKILIYYSPNYFDIYNIFIGSSQDYYAPEVIQNFMGME